MCTTFRITGANAGGPKRLWTCRIADRNAPPQTSSTYGSMTAANCSISRRSGRAGSDAKRQPPRTISPTTVSPTNSPVSSLTLPAAKSSGATPFSVLPRRRAWAYSGMNAWLRAPSPSSLRNRFGMVNATVNALATVPVPR